ncbi:MAG: threonylcarbamoyl-AMP synthase [Clostridia bacterium]|nr:threonylcarbamoyl-AMP synthase [Clostridia bacterium]
METLLLGRDSLSKAAELLIKDEVVAIPTETVYGLAANALKEDCVRKIYEAKGRPSDNPLIIHISKKEDVYLYAKEVSEKAEKLMDKFWPGPLTLIFKKKDIVPYKTTGGLDTVAIRMPKNEIALEIISKCNFPLAAPSANISGKPSPTSFSHVVFDMEGKISAIVDGGDCNVGVESTVLSAVDDEFILLRPGGVTPKEIEEVVGEIKISQSILNELDEKKEKVISPGMKYKHYAPNGNLYLVSGEEEKVIGFLKEKSKTHKTGIICYDDYSDIKGENVIKIGEKEDLSNQAKKIFSALRKFDNKEIREIYSVYPSSEGIGLAVLNRMLRAAGFNVIELG